MPEPSRARKPGVSGSFYPDDPSRLKRDIHAFLDNVPDREVRGRPLVLIEPHAGYVYSGQVAAYGYKLLKNAGIKKVAVISPSHVESFPFSSIYDGSAYETPLGAIPVDKELARDIAARAPDSIRLSDRGHVLAGSPRQEHALEVQLPFLQTVLRDFTLVPIVMGDQSWDQCRALGHALYPFLERPDFLVVVSSDLSHFHGYEAANEMDGMFCRLMSRMAPDELYDAVRIHDCEACGAGPVVASMIAAKRAGGDECIVLHAANSGDVSGDRGSVVGYASAVIRQSVPPTQTEDDAVNQAADTALTDAEKAHLLSLARHAVAVTTGIESHPPAALDTPGLKDAKGAFVTLKIAGRLRGCIGMIESRQPLTETVVEMARAAATGDPRFAVLSGEEFSRILIEISVLSKPRLVESWKDITVGRDGVIVEQGLNRGLLLPQVAVEAGWDAKAFLEFTCEKAALPRDAWRDDDTRIHTFSADVFAEDSSPGA
jgi:AmmeMemoRadiSam system protein B/AmmeMemoRadiSam system protein A